MLRGFKYFKMEVPDFESYKGCCQVRDVEEFLSTRGFREQSRTKFAEHQAGGYYDIVYRQTR